MGERRLVGVLGWGGYVSAHEGEGGLFVTQRATFDLLTSGIRIMVVKGYVGSEEREWFNLGIPRLLP